MKHDNQDDNHSTRQQFVGTGRDDNEHNRSDRNRRQGRQIGSDALSLSRPQPLNQKTSDYRQDHYPEDTQEHGSHININGLARQEPYEQWRQHRSQQRGDTRHADTQGKVALGQIGNDIRSSASRTTAHKNHTHRESFVEGEDMGQRISQQGHDRELGGTSQDNITRATEHHTEIIPSQCQTHTEHDDSQKGIDNSRFDMAESLRPQHGYHCGQQHQHAHIIGDQFAETFHGFNLTFLTHSRSGSTASEW